MTMTESTNNLALTASNGNRIEGRTSKLALQIVMDLLGIIPIASGFFGLQSTEDPPYAAAGAPPIVMLDSNLRFYAGVWIGLGLALYWLIHAIESQTVLFPFFRDFLGFWLTDEIAGIANFLTCNQEHHVGNIVKAAESRVHHLAFELRDSSCNAIAADALRAAGVSLLWGPSRHTAGHNLAAYHYDPDKVMIEFYTEMDTFIPELGMCEPRPWHEHFPMKPRSWLAVNAWGTEFGFPGRAAIAG